MSDDNVDIRVRLREAAKFRRDAQGAAKDVAGIGTAAKGAAANAKSMGSAVSSATASAGNGLGWLANKAKYGAAGLGALGAAGAKWGLSMNAQVESARLRFALFTDDVDGLVDAVSRLDAKSAFNLSDLSDAAAKLGNAGVSAGNVPKVLEGIANAAAASGGGAAALDSISRSIGQIQSKGKLSSEEVMQLTEALAPNVQKVIRRDLGLTADQLGNLGAQGVDGTKAIQAFTKEWTSGKIGAAAERQISSLGGQWDLLTGNMQKLSGAATTGLAGGLRDDVLPAANAAATAITAIFSDDTLAPEEKLRRARQVIKRELGPIADDIGDAIENAHLDQKLGDALSAAGPAIANAAGDVGLAAAGGFIDAWLEAPVWAQVASAAWLGKKLGGGKAIGKALGGGAGGAGGGMLSRGNSPANPLYVLPVSGGLGPGGAAPGAKGRGRGLVGAAATASGIVATVAAQDALARNAGYKAPAPSAAFSTGDSFTAQSGRKNASIIQGLFQSLGLTRATGPVGAGAAHPLSPAPGLGGFPLESHITLVTDGREIAVVNARHTAKAKARR